jgi:hypothetical protein
MHFAKTTSGREHLYVGALQGLANDSLLISADDGKSGNSKLAAEFDAHTTQNPNTQVEKYKLLAEFWRFIEVPGRQVFSGCFMLILCREQH